jgi:hypothetical protein
MYPKAWFIQIERKTQKDNGKKEKTGGNNCSNCSKEK